MSPKKDTQKSATNKKSTGFTDEEKAAMKERARELKAEANKAEGESAALAAIAALQEPDRSMARRIHAIVKDSAPTLSAKTWYGMPAYAALALELDGSGDPNICDGEVRWAIEHAPSEVREVLLQMPARKEGNSRLDKILYELDEGIRSRALPENA